MTLPMATALSDLDLAAVLDASGVVTSPVDVRTGPDVTRRLRAAGRLATTRGSTVVVSDDVARLPRPTCTAVVVHEMVHVLQQSDGAAWCRRDDSAPELEREASSVAVQVVRGHRVPRRRDLEPVPWRWMGHDSFEHRLLGDTPTNLLTAMVAGQGPGTSRDAGLAAACALLDYLGSNPTSVDPAKVQSIAGFPVNLVTLAGSGLTLTYGELNTLADYISSPLLIDSLDQSVLLPILQMTRSSGWSQLNAMRSTPQPDSAKTFSSFLPDIVVDTVSAMWETRQLDNLTAGVGLGGRDHYNGLNARNACHFAPFTWWRWQASYATAVAKAQAAYAGKGDPELVRLAWVAHGYADHFLQDAFAAGHLVNKSLIMQWFVEWVAGHWMPVHDWDAVKTMTQANQPGLSGIPLYSPSYAGRSNDPQTSEEQGAQSARIANTGIIAAGGQTQLQAYQSYLSWLDSSVCQIVTKQVHDYFNDSGLTVSSSQQTGFEVFGDATMLSGGTGVGLASATATLSRRSISDILATGGTDVTAQQLMATFPDQVLVDGSYLSLEDWHARGGPLWSLCRSDEVFDSWTTWGIGGGSHALPDLGIVSVDQPKSGSFTPVWGQVAAEGVPCGVQPAACTAFGDLYLVSQAAAGSPLLVTVAQGFGIEATTTTLPASPAGPPAAATLGGCPTVAWVATDGSISSAAAADGRTWTVTASVGAVTGANPLGGVALVQVGTQTVLFWTVGTGSTAQIAYAPLPADGSAATSAMVPKTTGGSRPVAATDGTSLFLAYQSGSQGIGAAVCTAGLWTSISPSGVKTSGGVGLQVLGGVPTLAYRGTDGGLWWGGRRGSSGASWSNQSLPGSAPTTGPAVAVDAGGTGFLLYGQNGALAVQPYLTTAWSPTGFCVGGYFSDSPVVQVPFGEGLLQLMTIVGIASTVAATGLDPSGWGTVTPVSSLGARARVGADILVTGDQAVLWAAGVDPDTGAVDAATFDGTTWSALPAVTGPKAALGDVAVVNWADTIHVFYPSGTSLCHSRWDADAAGWVALGAVPGVASPTGVSVTIVDGTLYVGYLVTGSTGTGPVMTIGWDGTTWQAPHTADSTSTSASVAGYGDAMVVVTARTDGNLYGAYSLDGGQHWNARTKLGPGSRPSLSVVAGVGADPEATGLLATFLSAAPGYSGLLTRTMTLAGG